MTALPETPATIAVASSGVEHRLVPFGRVSSVEEAALARSIDLNQLIKTIVVRESESRYLLILVPGDRVIDWAKLRGCRGVSRLSLPDADEAFAATGYRRGTITPFGAAGNWPVVADISLESKAEVSVGGGVSGLAIHLRSIDLIRATGAVVADVTKAAEVVSNPATSR